MITQRRRQRIIRAIVGITVVVAAFTQVPTTDPERGREAFFCLLFGIAMLGMAIIIPVREDT